MQQILNPTSETTSRIVTISDDKKYISIYLKRYGITEYLSNADGLYDLLATPSIVTYRYTKDFNGSYKNSHVQISLKDNETKKEICAPSFGQFAYLFYKYRKDYNSNLDFIRNYPIIRDTERRGDLNIDHLNGNYHNHCKYNLSMMSHANNTIKHNYASLFRGLYQVYFAVDEKGEYRVEYNAQSIATGKIETTFFKFKTIENLIDWLYIFTGKSSLTKKLNINYVLDDDSTNILLPRHFKPCIERDFVADGEHAEQLLSMSDDSFIDWTTTQKPTLAELIKILPSFLGISKE